jgi:hypothetical protein
MTTTELVHKMVALHFGRTGAKSQDAYRQMLELLVEIAKREQRAELGGVSATACRYLQH